MHCTIPHVLKVSCEMAASGRPMRDGLAVQLRQGQLQYDLWGVTLTKLDCTQNKDCKGWVEESLLVVPMPTALTSQMSGFK